MFVPTLSNAIYYEILENIRGKCTIAEPIFKVQNLQDTIFQEIDKTSKIDTYKFSIKNFILENNQSKRISEVDLEYEIEVLSEDKNFPIKYELFEEGENVNLLKENNKTDKIKIESNKEYEKIYTLKVTWNKKNENISDSNSLKIVVNSSQLKQE